MKKSAIFILAILLCSQTGSFGQTFEWNLRGGLNIMNSASSDNSTSVLYHLGAQAGVRVASFGFYGEALVSLNENQYGGDPVSYFMPGIIVKGYWTKFLFVEVGGNIMAMTGDSGVIDDTLNPDGKLFGLAGLGVHFSKIEISFRTNLSQSYPVLQFTGAVKF